MINNTAVSLATVSLLLLSHLSQADDFLDMLNAEAKPPVSGTQPSKVRIMDKVVAKNNAYLPKNKNEYRNYLKAKFHKTYLQYIKLNSKGREFVYEQYAESSFPRIEMTKEAIKKFLK